MLTIYDISMPISSRLPAWPGEPQAEVTRISTADGTAPSVSRIALSSHAGTHVDPPAHFIPGGITVDHLPLDVLIGPAWVVHLAGPGPIQAADLEKTALPADVARLLIRTDNSEHAVSRAAFDPHFVGLAPDAAGWLLARGVRLVGIDGPSIEPYGSAGMPVHRALLAAGVIIVENLWLADVAPGPYQLICLPLRIADGDGAPARAILVHNNFSGGTCV